MNIKPYDKTIRDLFGSGRQFVIPRFQREYSWDKKNYQEFLNDMLSNLVINNGSITSSQYFLGTMLFIGNFTEGVDQEIGVVDGQQRLTTITILFSAMSDLFRSINEEELSKQIFKYIMTKDDDGNAIRILKSKTHYPYFAYFIQDIKKSHDEEANTEEELCIKEAYDYFVSQLSERKLKATLLTKHGSDIVNSLSHVAILKALRDQVLNSTFVSISSTDKEQANKIFEILNAKGKKLANVDLIKNKIFETVNETEPADYAEDCWEKIKSTLYSADEPVGLATFFRHYWISKYKKVSESKLYESFLNCKIAKSDEECRKFLEDLLTNAKNYKKIINPSLRDYENRKEYNWLVQSLRTLNNDFNIVQTRIALLALFDIKNKDLISAKKFRETIIFLEDFHFAYNAVATQRANKLEKIYSSFAIELRKCTTKELANNVIETKLIAELEKIYPTWNDFSNKFTQLYYSKSDSPSNVKSKYAIYKLQCYISQKDCFEPDGSIEHIIPESTDNSLNIGNLILLEQNLNIEAGNLPYQDKIVYYRKSQYKWINNFVDEHDMWDETLIEKRALELAEIYYTKILKRNKV